MQTSKKMQEVITALAERHGVDLNSPNLYLRLKLLNSDKVMPLVVERIGENLLSVAHYYKYDGYLIADPDIVFFTGYSEWVAIEVNQIYGCGRRVVELNKAETGIVRLNEEHQTELGSFADFWASHIEKTGWLERAIRLKKE